MRRTQGFYTLGSFWLFVCIIFIAFFTCHIVGFIRFPICTSFVNLFLFVFRFYNYFLLKQGFTDTCFSFSITILTHLIIVVKKVNFLPKWIFWVKVLTIKKDQSCGTLISYLRLPWLNQLTWINLAKVVSCSVS